MASLHRAPEQIGISAGGDVLVKRNKLSPSWRVCLEKILGIKGASAPLSLSFFCHEREYFALAIFSRPLSVYEWGEGSVGGKAFRFNSQFPSREGGEEGETFETWLADRNFGGFVNLDLTSIFHISPYFSEFLLFLFRQIEFQFVKFDLMIWKNSLRLLTSNVSSFSPLENPSLQHA